ncbi:MAG: GreA/GreB family elongation factor [Candidatus Uhrbacteria bacterium]|nr:GreA/GreB family elongation factor [Candidatus Uhrbacteria bacterium]
MRLPTRQKELDNNQLKGDDGPVYLTKAGLEKLNHQLIDFEIQHKQAVKDTQTTGELGDFSENAEYQEAKHRMRNLASRMTIIKEKLKNVVVIEKDENDKDRIQLGSTVVLNMNDHTLTFEIVGPQEANPVRGRISHLSPLGSHLIGHTAGETISVVTHGDELIYTILEVK